MYNQENKNSKPYDDGAGLKDLLNILWIHKLQITLITLSATVVAIIVAFMLPNIYRAEVLLAPNKDQGAGGLAALASQYGGLASLAGINIGGGGADDTAFGLEVLKSRKFISDYIQSHEILVPLIAADGWDSETGDVRIDSDDYDLELKKWVRDVSAPKKIVPSLQEAYDEFIDILSVSQDKKTGFVTIAIEHYSPTIAKDWVDWLVEDLNKTVMQSDVEEAEQAIAYLNEQIKGTSLAEMQSVFFRLIEEQTKTVMLAKVSSEYLLKTVDPAVAPEEKAKPQRGLIVVPGALFGFLIAVAIVFLSSSSGREEDD